MNLDSAKRQRWKAVLAFSFVCLFFGMNASNEAFASCGDYLHHAGSVTAGKVNLEHPDFSLPSSGCKNGRCRSAPIPIHNEPSRVVIAPRQQANLFQMPDYDFDALSLGSLASGDDTFPIQPSLDLLVPPPRAI